VRRGSRFRECAEHLVGVLPDRGLRTLHARRRCRVHPEGDAGLPHGTEPRVVDHHRHAVVDHLLVLERLVRVPDRRDRDLVGPEPVEQVLALHPTDRVADHVLERLATGRVPLEVGGIDAEDLPDDAAILAPPSGEVHRAPTAVGALVDAGTGLEADLEPWLDPVLGVLPQLGGERQHPLVQGLDPLPGVTPHVARRGSPQGTAASSATACRRLGPSRNPGCSYRPERAAPGGR
jgi:hypothetical protein